MAKLIKMRHGKTFKMFTIKLLLTLSLLYSVSGSIILPGPNTTAADSVTADCTITQYSQVDSVIKSCTNILLSNVNVPSGKSLNLALKDGSTLTIRGTISFDVGYNDIWLTTISGNSITVIGETGSVFHGQGEKYWDGQGGGGVTKPKLLQILNVNKGLFKNINLKNCPLFCTGITKAYDVTISGWKADCSEGDSKGGRNTDGIGISWSKNIVIDNAFIHNQDQCLYVNQGYDMVFTRIHCVGSNGIAATAGFATNNYEENTVKNITFHNCVLEGGLVAIQAIAIASGGPGEITNINFQNIELKDMTYYGIWIQMDYGNRGHPNNNIAITGLRLSNVYGTVKGNAATPVYIYCGSKCSNWKWSNIAITGGGKANSCNYQPDGFKC